MLGVDVWAGLTNVRAVLVRGKERRVSRLEAPAVRRSGEGLADDGGRRRPGGEKPRGRGQEPTEGGSLAGLTRHRLPRGQGFF